MRLLYIANIRLPAEKAHGIQIMKTCEALAKHAVELELIVPNRRTPILQDPFDFYSVKKIFTLTRLPCIDLVSTNRFGAVGFWIQSWLFYRAVKKYLRMRKADAYYTRDLPMAAWLTRSARPFFYEIHTLPPAISRRYRDAWRRVQGIVVISDALKRALIREGVSEKKILVARDAVDVERFTVKESKEESRKRLRLPLDQKIVVYTGHLYEWKGANLLADTAAALPSDIHVYLVGGTKSDISAFKKKYRALNVHIAGWQSLEAIPYWLKAADLLVLPNSSKDDISALYTSPLKLFEYMASGTPMLLADLPSIREVMGGHGWYFHADNRDSLAQKIQEGLRGSTELERAALWARQEAQKHHWGCRAQYIRDFIFKPHE